MEARKQKKMLNYKNVRHVFVIKYLQNDVLTKSLHSPVTSLSLQ